LIRRVKNEYLIGSDLGTLCLPRKRILDLKVSNAQDSNLGNGNRGAWSTNIFSIFYHRMTHNFAQDAFFNKHHRTKTSFPVFSAWGGRQAK
jgi:hypothetical protein